MKMFPEVVYKLSKTLTPKEFTIAMALSKFVSYETCALKIGYGKNCHFMTLQEIADVMEIEYSRMSRIMSSLISKGVVGQLKIGDISTKKVNKYYIVNPYIYMNGRNLDKETYKYFSESGWEF